MKRPRSRPRSGPAVARKFSTAPAAAIVIGAVLALGTPAAFATQLDEQVSLTTAEQACLSGSYQRGVDILATLYIATRKPAYIHNQARCFEQNGQYEAAIARYAEFLRQAKDLPQEKRSQIEANVARLEQAVARQRGGAPGYGQGVPGNPAAPQPAPPAADGPQSQQPGYPGTYPGAYPGGPLGASGYPTYPNGAPVDGSPALSPPGNHLGGSSRDLGIAKNGAAGSAGNPGLRVAGPVAAGLGGIILVGAVIAGLKANSTASEIADDAKNHVAYDQSKFDSGKSAATLSTIGFVAGPVLVAAGALLYWMGLPREEGPRAAAATKTALTSPTFSWAPAVAKQGASLHLGVTY